MASLCSSILNSLLVYEGNCCQKKICVFIDVLCFMLLSNIWLLFYWKKKIIFWMHIVADTWKVGGRSNPVLFTISRKVFTLHYFPGEKHPHSGHLIWVSVSVWYPGWVCVWQQNRKQRYGGGIVLSVMFHVKPVSEASFMFPCWFQKVFWHFCVQMTTFWKWRDNANVSTENTGNTAVHMSGQ